MWVWGLIWVTSFYSRWGKFTSAMDLYVCALLCMRLSLHPLASRFEWGISFLSTAVKSLPRSHLLVKGWPVSWQVRKSLRTEDTIMMFIYHKLHRKGIGCPFTFHPPGIQAYICRNPSEYCPLGPHFQAVLQLSLSYNERDSLVLQKIANAGPPR